MEQTDCSETSAYKIQTPGNNPKESIQQTQNICCSCQVTSYKLLKLFTPYVWY